MPHSNAVHHYIGIGLVFSFLTTSIPPVALAADNKTCQTLFASSDDAHRGSEEVDAVSLYRRILTGKPGGMISENDLRHMLRENDFFSLVDPGPSEKVHVQLALKKIRETAKLHQVKLEGEEFRKTIEEAIVAKHQAGEQSRLVRNLQAGEVLRDGAPAYALATIPETAQVLASGDRDAVSEYSVINTRGPASALASRQLESTGSSVATFLEASADGRFVVGADATTVFLWDLKSGELWRSWDLEKRLVGSVTALAVSPTGKYLVAGTDHRHVLVWDRERDRPVQVLALDTQILSVRFSADEQWALALDAHGRLEEFRVQRQMPQPPNPRPLTASMRAERPLGAHDVVAGTFSRDSTRVVTVEDGPEKATVHVYETATGSSIDSFSVPRLARWELLTLSPGNRFVIMAGDERLVLHDLETKTFWSWKTRDWGTVIGATFLPSETSPDGELIVATSKGPIRRWKL